MPHFAISLGTSLVAILRPLIAFVALTCSLGCATNQGWVPPDGPEIAVIFEEAAMNATAVALAQSHIDNRVQVASWEARKLFLQLGGKLLTIEGGQKVEITRDNEQFFLAHYQMRLEAYGRAIERRGYESIGGGYDVTAQPGCAPFLSSVARPEGVVKTNPAETMWITTFDGKDFAFLLATKGEYETWKNKKLEKILETDPLLRHGVVVESQLAVRATIVDDYFKGSVDGDRIELSGPGCSLVLRRRRSE